MANKAFSRELRELQAALKASACPLSTTMDDSCLKLTIGEGQAVKRVSIFFGGLGAYPATPALIMCEDDEAANTLLAPLCDDFADYAPVAPVVCKICDLLGVANCPPLDTIGQPGSTAADEEAADTAGGGDAEAGGSDMEGSYADEDGSDASGDSGDEYDMAEDDDVELMKTILQKLSRWEQLEKQRTEADEAAAAEAAKRSSAAGSTAVKGSGLSHDEKRAQKLQIFNAEEGFKILCKELMALMKEGDNLMVDAVGDDVHCWNVCYLGVTTGGGPAKDAQQRRSQNSASCLELRLRFRRGLYPFYPPAVELIRPRCQRVLLGALSSHPMLQLKTWDPWRPIKELLQQLRAFLEEAAEVDASSPFNDSSKHPESAYLAVERQLARLEALSALPPMCYAQHEALYNAREAGVDAARIEALDHRPKRAKTDAAAEPATGKAWAAGTGYGYRSGARTDEVWDAAQAEAAQAAHDAELEGLLSDLASQLHQHFPDASGVDTLTSGLSSVQVAASSSDTAGDMETEPSTSHGRTSQPPEACITPSRRLKPTQAQGAGKEAQQAQQQAPAAVQPSSMSGAELGLCVEALEASCLLPFFDRELSNASFTDMSSRYLYYTAMLQVAQQLCTSRTQHLLSRPILRETQPEEGSSAARQQGPKLTDIFKRLELQASQFLTVMRSGPKQKGAKAQAGESSTGAFQAPSAADDKAAVEEARTISLATLITAIHKRCQELAPAQPQGRTTRRQAAATSRTNSESPTGNGSYAAQMKRFQVDMLPKLARGHVHLEAMNKEGVHPRQRMVRVGKELAGLAADLPLNPSSSVFVRVDEEHVMLWKAIITGPEGTPYSGGCFLFDIYFPPAYPNEPPKVLLKTTGGGRVRFNPNLYNCGKVCLSLLGTWSGDKGESWSPVVSSALQVLISIQSLIFVDEPYFNEPGYESTMHTPAGRDANKQYNQNIREQTMRYAMLDMLKSPAEGFGDVVRTHFKLQQGTIVSTCESWIAEAGGSDAAGRMRTLLDQIRTQIAKLA